MKNIWTIMRKELKRVFGDKRLIFSVFILPGLMIYVMYSIMGNALTNMEGEAQTQTSVVYTVNMPNEIKSILETKEFDFNVSFQEIATLNINDYKNKILNNEIDYIIEFDSNFVNSVENNLTPNVNTYYNPVNDRGNLSNDKIQLALSVYKETVIYNQIGTVFSVNANNTSNVIMNENKAVAKGFSLLLPFLIITFLYSGAMSVGPESIAGEKERGTMATLLVTPTNRTHIALGKIFSLTIIATTSAVSSFLGIILSLPKLMGISGEDVNTNIYAFGDYMFLLFVIISTVLVFIGLISVLSAYAKNVKEATVFIMPLMIISMLIGLTTMFSSNANQNWYIYLIPVFNSVQMMTGIFSFEFNILHFILTVSSNLVIVSIVIFALTKMFNSEKIMFSK